MTLLELSLVLAWSFVWTLTLGKLKSVIDSEWKQLWQMKEKRVKESAVSTCYNFLQRSKLRMTRICFKLASLTICSTTVWSVSINSNGVSLLCLLMRLRLCLKCRFCLTRAKNKAQFLWHCPLWWPKWRQKKRASLKMHFNEKMVCNKSSKNRLFFWLGESIFCGLVLVIGTSKVYYLQLMCCGGSYLKEIMH